MNNNKLKSHLNELRRKHRELDEEIIRLGKHHVSAEVRQMKTQKLWIKDEIYRVEEQLSNVGEIPNGYH